MGSRSRERARPGGREGFERHVWQLIDKLAGEADHPYYEVRSRLEAILMAFEEADRDPVPLLLQKLRAGPRETLWVTGQLLEAVEVTPERLLPVLSELLPSMPPEDNARISLVSLAFRAGLVRTLVEQELVTLVELDELHDLSRQEALDQLEQDPFAAISLYEGARELPVEVAVKMVEDFATSERAVVVPLLALWAEHPSLEVARAALAGLARYPMPETRRLLEGLETHRLTLETEIEALLERLQQAGIEPHRPALGPVHRCLIGPADGRGMSMVHLSRIDAAARVSYVHLMLSEDRGITECVGLAREEMDEYQVLERNLIEDEMVTASLDMLRSRVEEALFIHRERSLPAAPTFVLWRHLLEEPLEPGRPPIDLSAYGVDDVRPQLEAILPRTAALLEASPFRDWWPDVQSAYDFVMQHSELTEVETPPDELVDLFLETCRELEPARQARRLARTVQYLAARGWEGDERLLIGALAVWVALTERVMPLRQIPFFQALGRVTLTHVGTNVSLGFTTPADGEEEWVQEH